MACLLRYRRSSTCPYKSSTSSLPRAAAAAVAAANIAASAILYRSAYPMYIMPPYFYHQRVSKNGSLLWLFVIRPPLLVTFCIWNGATFSYWLHWQFTTKPNVFLHDNSRWGKCGWLYKEHIGLIECLKWRPFAFTHTRRISSTGTMFLREFYLLWWTLC